MIIMSSLLLAATAVAMNYNNSIFLRRHAITVRRSQVCCFSDAVAKFQFSSILDNYNRFPVRRRQALLISTLPAAPPAGRGIMQCHQQQQKVSYSSLQRELQRHTDVHVLTVSKMQQQDSTSNNDTPTNDNYNITVCRQGSSSAVPSSSSYSSSRRRNFSTTSIDDEESTTTTTWIVPNHILIPDDKVLLSYSRSSGAGGQNVNKVNTKVELRLHIPSAHTWGLPFEVIQRLQTNEASRINKEGYLILTSQEYRTQIQNKKDVLQKLQSIIKVAYVRPKVRNMRVGLSKVTKMNRIDEKRKNSMKKESRGRVDF
jgi:protein subunit release factor B